MEQLPGLPHALKLQFFPRLMPNPRFTHRQTQSHRNDEPVFLAWSVSAPALRPQPQPPPGQSTSQVNRTAPRPKCFSRLERPVRLPGFNRFFLLAPHSLVRDAPTTRENQKNVASGGAIRAKWGSCLSTVATTGCVLMLFGWLLKADISLAV